MEDFTQPTGEADPFGAAGGDDAFGMSAPPLDGEPSAGFAAEPLDGVDAGGAGMGDFADAGGGDFGGGGMGEMGGSMGEMGGMDVMGGGGSAGDMGGGGSMGDMGSLDVMGRGGSTRDAGGFGSMGDMGALGGEANGSSGVLDMATLADPGPPPEPEGPKISEASLSAIAKWRMEHSAMVEEKTVREAAKQQEMLSTAKADMQAVFKAREEKKAKRVAVNREEQTQMQLQRNASTAEDGPAVWNQVGLISDLKEKANPSTDTSRMRSLLVQLKHS